jgi:hypothetical protein
MIDFRLVKANSNRIGFHEDVYELRHHQYFTNDVIIDSFIHSPYHPFTVAYGSYVVEGNRLVHRYDTSG